MTVKDRLAQQHLSRLAEVMLGDATPEDVQKAILAWVDSPGLRKRMALIIRDYCSDHMRPEIKKFAGLMELKLRKHDSARGQRWKEGEPLYHIGRIENIFYELKDAVDAEQKVGIKAADLANHAMMLADQFGELQDIE
jgi:hypothetical protein